MAYKSLNPIYKIVAFAEAKRHGDIQTIAQMTGYSQAHVSNTLRGNRKNDTIVNKAYRLIKNRQTNLQRLSGKAE